MTAMQLNGAKVLVVGVARSGLAAAGLLRRQGAIVEAVDSTPPGRMPEAARQLAEWDVRLHAQTPDAFRNRDLIVISPGVPADLEPLVEARAAGVSVIGEVELAAWFLQGNVIGITGSNGKTTTTALVGHILRESGIPAQVGGNIGTPPTSMVHTSRSGQWNVLELSSFQLETIHRFRAHVAVAINVTADHLDRHGTFAAYAAAKARLFETQTPEDFAILNADDPSCVSFAALTSARPLWFSSNRAMAPGLWVDRNAVLFDDQHLIRLDEIPLRGRHNVENVMAAAAAARLAGAGLPAIAAAIRTFPGVEHRLEFVRSLDGIDFYNDSKATNVDAALKALDAFAGPLVPILGGKDKGSDYTPLNRPLGAKARVALLIGAASAKIAAHLGSSVPWIECGTLQCAVATARREARSGDTVLLAPACASFDQFENFEHRGRTFKKLVNELEAGG